MDGKKVITAGVICLDVTPKFPQKKTERLSDVMRPGRMLRVDGVEVSLGGAVSNTGLAMKMLGADVTLMGKIGKDEFGDIIYRKFSEYGAEKDLIVSDEGTTSYSVVLALPGIDRIFIHDPGVNNLFYADDIPREALEETALFHLGYPTVMRSLYVEDGAELVRILQKARRCGAATSLDFSAIDAETETALLDWEKILERSIPYVDFLVPSVEELCFMLDRERFHEWNERAAGRDITEILDIERDVKPLADRCMAMGARVLLIKCGAAGIYYRTAGRDTLAQISSRVGLDAGAWADRCGFERSYVPERVLSGTGAGDTCIAAFLTAMLRGSSLENAVHLAAAAGASCVEAYDTLSGLKPLEELQRKINAGWKKYGD